MQKATLPLKLSAFIGIGVTLIASFIKLNYMFGTFGTFFSATQIATPLAGAFGGPIAAFAVFITRTLLYGAFHPSYSMFFYHIPTLAAGLYLSTESKFIKILLPLICMILFIAHPVGNIAAIYSIYWLIPIIITLKKPRSFFAKSLGATFTAHAVGSVIFLYTKTTTPLLWHSLILVAPIERIMFAAGMTTVYLCIKLTTAYLNKAPLLKKIPIYGS